MKFVANCVALAWSAMLCAAYVMANMSLEAAGIGMLCGLLFGTLIYQSKL